MAKNVHWVGNLNGVSEPLVRRCLFQAGATQAIEKGQFLEFTGNTNAAFVPLDSDYDMSSAHDVAISKEKVEDGDRAGYYDVIIPRPGDLFECDLAAAGANAEGTDVYYDGDDSVTITAGTNIIGKIVGLEHYPPKMAHLASGDIGNPGVTIRSVSKCIICIEESNSYYARLQVA